MELGEWADEVARLVAEDCAAVRDTPPRPDGGFNPPLAVDMADAIRQRYGLDKPTDEPVVLGVDLAEKKGRF